MSPSTVQNVAASVRQRLLNLAHQRGEEFQFVLTRFALERLLYRLGQSSYSEDFLLKGAMLFAVWREEAHRPTTDLDLGSRQLSQDRLREIFREICGIASPEDALSFDTRAIAVEPIRELQLYPGARLRITARLGNARIPFQVDVGFGDAVVPGPVRAEYPTLLDHPAPRLKVYPRESVVAEKFQAMVFLGMANTRLKDFYDLWLLARSFEFQGDVLCRAFRATFDRRQTALPREVPVALTPEFSEDRGKVQGWRGFLRRNRLDAPDSLAEVCAFLGSFLLQPSRAAVEGAAFVSSWRPGGPWQGISPAPADLYLADTRT